MNLFNEQYEGTSEAYTLAQRVGKLLAPIYKEYIELGYSPREVQHVINGESYLCMFATLAARHGRWRPTKDLGVKQE